MCFEGVTFDVRDFAAGTNARSGDTERSFGEAVDWKKRGGVEAVFVEAVGEALKRFGANGLGAIESDTPRAQVDALEIAVVDFAGAEFVGEVGSGRKSAAMGGHGAEPADGAGEEGERRHGNERDAEAEGNEPGADKAHVMVKREPTDRDVVGAKIDGVADGADVGEEIGVSEDDAFGITGGTGRVLEEGDVGGEGRMEMVSGGANFGVGRGGGGG